MMYILKKLKKKDEGSMVPLVVVSIFISLILFCVGWEYLRMVTIMTQLDRAVEMSVENVAKDNWKNVYQSVREGYAGAYTKNEEGKKWEEVMNKQNILGHLNKTINFKTDGTTWVKKDEKGNVLFSIKPKDTEVKIINTGLAAKEGDALVVETTNTITIPLMFAGLWPNAQPLVIHRTTKCQYIPKF